MKAVFAIPGDRHRRTGGFIYESTVLDELRALGHDITHLQLPANFPNPDASDIAETLAALQAVPRDTPILLDGFIPGTVDPLGLAQIQAPLVPIIHHPLGLETGLPSARAAFLLENERASLAHATRIVVPSPHTARILTSDFDVPGDRITVAEPGFDAPCGTRQPTTPPLILAVGLLAERKGHDILIDALAHLPDLVWQAAIVGGTHDLLVTKALQDRAQATEVAHRITFTGGLDDAPLQELYAQASIFALATRYEGYGIVFGEAMKWGLPIVACRGGAVADTVGSAGHLVDVDDSAAFAAALRRLLTDPAHYDRLAETSRARGQALPTWRDTAKRVAAVCEAANQPAR